MTYRLDCLLFSGRGMHYILSENRKHCCSNCGISAALQRLFQSLSVFIYGKTGRYLPSSPKATNSFVYCAVFSHTRGFFFNLNWMHWCKQCSITSFSTNWFPQYHSALVCTPLHWSAPIQVEEIPQLSTWYVYLKCEEIQTRGITHPHEGMNCSVDWVAKHKLAVRMVYKRRRLGSFLFQEK